MVQTSCAHTEGSFAHEDGKTLPCNTGKSFGLRDYREVAFPQTSKKKKKSKTDFQSQPKKMRRWCFLTAAKETVLGQMKHNREWAVSCCVVGVARGAHTPEMHGYWLRA